jgi:cytochrome b561
MKTDHNAQLGSIRRVLWLILGVLLLMFGYDHTPIGKAEQGALLPILALMFGIGIILLIVGRMVLRFLMGLKNIADGKGE